MEFERYFTATEVAKMFGVSRGQIYRLINSGQLETVSVGSCIRIKASVLQGFIDRNTNTTSSQTDITRSRKWSTTSKGGER